MERLKRAVIEGTISSAVIFSILPEIPSGPVDLVVSNDFSSSVTSPVVQSKSSEQVFTWFVSRGILGGTLRLKHWELRASAFAWSVESNVDPWDRVGIDELFLFNTLIDFQNCFALWGLSLRKCSFLADRYLNNETTLFLARLYLRSLSEEFFAL